MIQNLITDSFGAVCEMKECRSNAVNRNSRLIMRYGRRIMPWTHKSRKCVRYHQLVRIRSGVKYYIFDSPIFYNIDIKIRDIVRNLNIHLDTDTTNQALHSNTQF